MAIVVSAFGLAGLLYSLVLTRRATQVAIDATQDADAALKFAGRNADSAAAQVAIAKEASRHQLRAYVALFKTHIERFPEQDSETQIAFQCYTGLKNRGKAAALRVRTRQQRFMGPACEPDFDWLASTEWQAEGAMDRGSKGYHQEWFSIDRTAAKLIRERTWFHFWLIELEYSDVFGARYLQQVASLQHETLNGWILHSQPPERVTSDPNHAPRSGQG